MDFRRILANAIARRIAFVLVAAVLAWCGMGKAQAQAMCGLTRWQDAINATYPSSNYTFPSRAAAQAACNSVPSTMAEPAVSGWHYPIAKQACTLNAASKNFTLKAARTGTNYHPTCNQSHQTWSPYTNSATGWYFNGDICPAGETWNADTQTCFNSQRCLDKSALGNGLISGTATSACIDGCAFAAPDGGTTLSFNGSNFVTMSKGWQPTGAACAAGTPTPNTEDPQVCKDLGNGQTACVKQDGQECYKGPIGDPMQFCWKPGEVGDKNDGKNRQKRNAGETPIAPNLSLPSGDNLQQKGPPIVTQVTNNNTTTTTTTTNFQTQHGTDANGGGKPSNDGEPDDGSGEGEGDGEEGTATGGGDCKSPPIVTGDQILGMVANQAWQTRCAVEAGNGVKVTGDVGNCAEPFSVEGTHANAQQLRAMRAQICKGDANGDGQPDWTKPDGTEAGDGGGDDDEPGFLSRVVNTDMLDTGGFLGGGGQCPQLGELEFGPFGSFSLDSQPYFCDLIALMRGVVILVGVFLALRILTGDVL
ncbi:hypothetical protein [Lysobacter sp. FW306-1B-D06B]|uniref:hypothetical protein n=1 Tax=Lysobacter sp. FW306-1B-D06B TaxID=3140250 RepID=UPI0031400581